MRLSLLLPFTAAVGLGLSALSVTALPLFPAVGPGDPIGHAGGCFRVDATQCCHAGPDRYHCH